MEMRHLRYFVAVAEELNFRRAAERLRLAQPALSAQIRDLEEELGARLLERTTRAVSLTPAGRALLERARDVLERAALAADVVKRAGLGLSGVLRLGMIAHSATVTFARALRHFHQRYPEVEIIVSDLPSGEQCSLIRNGELDAGLIRHPLEPSGLEWRDFEEFSRCLAAPSGHRLARKERLAWEDFDGEGMVMVKAGLQHGFYTEFMDACAKAGAKVHPTQYARDISSMLWLVSAGFGIAPTTAAVSKIKLPGLVFLPLPPGLPQVKTVIAWKRNSSSPILRNFLNSLAAASPPARLGSTALKTEASTPPKP